MVSLSIPISSSFIPPKSPVASPHSPPTCARFRPTPRLSAAYTSTAERTTASRSHSRIATEASLYEILGIPMGASCLEVKSAYRRLARVLHPDVASNGQNHTSTDEFIRIHDAYSTLSDPQKRADYDQTLFRRRRPVSSPFVRYSTSPSASVFSGYTPRTWETDQCW
ncbi:hypothetical protein U1Q18_016072 [Sarracenia purpurea var. burkii]